MNSLPAFLKLNSQPNQFSELEIQKNTDYQPLLGIWLIDIALSCDWIKSPPSGLLWDIFGDSDYQYLTGLPQLECILPDSYDDIEDVDSRIDAYLVGEALGVTDSSAKTGRNEQCSLHEKQATLKKELLRCRKVLFSQLIDGNLPLFQNIQRLGRLLNLNDTDMAVLTFTVCLSNIERFKGALASCKFYVSDEIFGRLLSRVLGLQEEDVRRALARNGILCKSGVIEVDHEESLIQTKVTMLSSLSRAIFDPLSHDEELSSQIIRRVERGSLSLKDFSHISDDISLLLDYLTGALNNETRGVNILFYGPPGCGKTELAKVIAVVLGVSLYQIAYSDEDGEPIVGRQRLQNFNFCQSALSGKGPALLLFDEVEDVLSGTANFNFISQISRKHGRQEGKAWFNRTLEDNPIPTVWITNDATIDEAYLRRFDYSLALRIPPKAVRERIAATYLGDLAMTSDSLVALGELDDLLPSQLNQAARVARLSTINNPELAWKRVEMTLLRSRELLGQRRSSLRPPVTTAYNQDFLNTNANIPAIIKGLQRLPSGSFLFYGPSGSGKSLLARKLADTLGKPCLVKRASDLLDKYLGETEQRIAAMFNQARDDDAVLILDEADSFLTERSSATHSWEITHTNEFLTQLECFEGIFFATTNFLENLDTALWRRFSYKIKFDYLSSDQTWSMFQQEAERLGCSAELLMAYRTRVMRLKQLTPGDFAIVSRANKASHEQPSIDGFLEGLESEVKFKQQGRAPLGFL